MADVLGHIGYFFIALSLYLLGRGKHKEGFLVNSVGCSLWFIVGTQTGLTSAMFWNLIFIAINLRGLARARRGV